jgi:hypothetical protein
LDLEALQALPVVDEGLQEGMSDANARDVWEKPLGACGCIPVFL